LALIEKGIAIASTQEALPHGWDTAGKAAAGNTLSRTNPPCSTTESRSLGLCAEAAAKQQRDFYAQVDARRCHYGLQQLGTANVLENSDTATTTKTYMLCAIRQCGVLGFRFGTTTSTPTIVSSLEKNLPEIREGPIKPQPSPNSWPPSCDIAVSTSGVEITKWRSMQ
jgi:hypothetical protein